MSINQLYTIAEKIRKSVLSVWISYFTGIFLEIISEADAFEDAIRTMGNLYKPAVFLFWLGTVVVVLVWGIYLVFGKVTISQTPSAQFRRLMKEHTCPMLNKAEYPGYSWGYNRNLIVPRNPSGWKPGDIYIDGVNSRIDIDYTFPDTDIILEGYTQSDYLAYCENSNKIRVIRERGDDRERFAAYFLKLNSERRADKQKVEIRLQKTKWSQLQFSWDMLRRLDTRNIPVSNTGQEARIEELYTKSFEKSELLINSFCLHLILISKSGKAILSRISHVKSNDYPETWAATIGEQIEKEDFLDEITGDFYKDFVIRWVKRALKEEFDINEGEYTDRGTNELEEYVDMDSLRILSVDMEGDIYNVALTCSIKLRISADQLKKIKGVIIDGNEMKTEFRECSMSEIRRILLDYPNNRGEYHPSTYLRLLMYHLAFEKVKNTCRNFVKDEKKVSRTITKS